MSTNLSQLELFILSALIAKERYGLEIIEVIEEATGRKGILSLGSLPIWIYFDYERCG